MPRKFLTHVDLAKNELQNATIQNLASAPGTPIKGLEYFDTTLNQFGVYNGTGWVYLGSGGGTVTSVSVVSANGLAGTVATPSTTPAITLTTTATGVLKGSASTIVPAVSGTDYVIPSGSITGTAANITGIAAIANGGTGSSTQNFIDLTTAQTVAGVKTFSANPSIPSPVAANDAATKAYVDSTAQGLDVKASARAATVGTETFTITAGSVTTINGTTVDGITLAIGDRVLIKDAPAATGAGSVGSNQPGNGIYTVTANTTNLTVARAADQSGSFNPMGDFVFVETGTTNTAAGFTVTSPSTAAAFTYGTGTIQWTQFSGAGQIIAGTGITKTGNTIALSTPVAVNNGGTGTTTSTGSGANVLATSPTLVTPVLGTPTSATLTNATGLPLTTGVTGVLPLANGGTNATTAAAARSNLAATGKFIATIGDGVTTAIAVTHNLGTTDVIAQVRDSTTNVVVDPDITQTSTTVTTFTFITAPATGAYKVVIIG